ncbi:MAG TPA: hypothetical protein VGF45_10455 [Polyangia bacterium]
MIAGAFHMIFALATVGPAHAQESVVPTASETAASVTRYGVGVRMPRWVSVPGWFLDLFAKENVPLSTFGSFGVEFFGRRGDYDIVLGLSYQNMSPADGNWLGKNKEASLDTDFVQMRDLALLGADVSFVSRQMVTNYFGFHYGAGLGLAIVRGEVLRISNSGNCTAANAGNERLCRPLPCPENGCTEAMLKATEGAPDGGPSMPHRFKDQDIPGAFPILNVTVGVDFRLPEVPGLEARLEGGFYDAFFLGASFAYVFF